MAIGWDNWPIAFQWHLRACEIHRHFELLFWYFHYLWCAIIIIAIIMTCGGLLKAAISSLTENYAAFIPFIATIKCRLIDASGVADVYSPAIAFSTYSQWNSASWNMVGRRCHAIFGDRQQWRLYKLIMRASSQRIMSDVVILFLKCEISQPDASPSLQTALWYQIVTSGVSKTSSAWFHYGAAHRHCEVASVSDIVRKYKIIPLIASVIHRVSSIASRARRMNNK